MDDRLLKSVMVANRCRQILAQDQMSGSLRLLLSPAFLHTNFAFKAITYDVSLNTVCVIFDAQKDTNDLGRTVVIHGLDQSKLNSMLRPSSEDRLSPTAEGNYCRWCALDYGVDPATGVASCVGCDRESGRVAFKSVAVAAKFRLADGSQWRKADPDQAECLQPGAGTVLAGQSMPFAGDHLVKAESKKG